MDGPQEEPRLLREAAIVEAVATRRTGGQGRAPKKKCFQFLNYFSGILGFFCSGSCKEVSFWLSENPKLIRNLTRKFRKLNKPPEDDRGPVLGFELFPGVKFPGGAVCVPNASPTSLVCCVRFVRVAVGPSAAEESSVGFYSSSGRGV